MQTLVFMTGGALVAQGALRHDPGNSEEIAAAREAVRQVAAALGEDHPVTAMMLRNLAFALEQGGYHNYCGALRPAIDRHSDRQVRTGRRQSRSSVERAGRGVRIGSALHPGPPLF